MTDWEEDCARYVGHPLTGKFAHWCRDWDLLPVDETQPEFECCTCFRKSSGEARTASAPKESGHV